MVDTRFDLKHNFEKFENWKIWKLKNLKIEKFENWKIWKFKNLNHNFENLKQNFTHVLHWMVQVINWRTHHFHIHGGYKVPVPDPFRASVESEGAIAVHALVISELSLNWPDNKLVSLQEILLHVHFRLQPKQSSLNPQKKI